MILCIIDAENPLASPDLLPASGGLVGISEAVELEEGSTHDHDSMASNAGSGTHFIM